MDIPLHESCSVIQSHPAGLMAVNKAAGVLSHPNRGQDNRNTLLLADYHPDEEVYMKGNREWYLLNRLDAPTSGIILLASSRDVAAAAKAEFASHSVKKTYLAVIKGILPRKKDTWRDCLEVTRRSGQLRTRVTRDKPNAVTEVLLKERGNGPPARSLIELNPVTGRTHQLRVQCASRNFPIVGDATYGDFDFNKLIRKRTGAGRLLLHSWKVSLEMNIAGKSLCFNAECPVPEIFAVALR